MMLIYQPNGNLEPGIHEINLQQLNTQFGFNKRRRYLIQGLLVAIRDLKDCNCSVLYLDGSFASDCDHPNDYDACYDPAGMDFQKLFMSYPIFFDFDNGRQNQKLKYRGELMPMTFIAKPPSTLYIDLFQKDKHDDSPKGILKLNLNNIP